MALICLNSITVVFAQKTVTKKFGSVSNRQPAPPAKGSLNYLKIEAVKSYSIFRKDSILWDSVLSKRIELKSQIREAKRNHLVDDVKQLKLCYVDTYNITSKQIKKDVVRAVKKANTDKKKLDRVLSNDDSLSLMSLLFRKINHS